MPGMRVRPQSRDRSPRAGAGPRRRSALRARATGLAALLVLLVLLFGARGTVLAGPPQRPAAPRLRQQQPAPSLTEQLMKGSDPLLRETAALVLGDGGDRAALPALLTCLRADDNRWVRAACAEALGRLGQPTGLPALTQAIEREKHPRVRRAIARALVRLGQRSGVSELMWQLETGAQHDKAEAMHLLVHAFGQALGQAPAPWWRFFNQQGYRALAARAAGSTELRELAGLRGADGRRWGPLLIGAEPARWLQVCAAVLRVDPGTRLAIGAPELLALERRQGLPPSGCLLLISSDWQHAPAPAPAPTPRALKRLARAARRKAAAPTHAPLAGPGLTEGAVRLLLQRAPGLLGIGIDAPRLDPISLADEPALRLLSAAGKLVITHLDGLRELPQQRLRVLLVPGQPAPARARPVLVLALIP
ncbi:MAG: HEAT repeat domain-containing protein [Proteobacteria bacterium]|nr:HEAT repeat domain-containing protein [Pseudomonadota bacterium]